MAQNSRAADFAILKPVAFAHHVSRFNSMEDENVTNFISNAQSWRWLQKEIPIFECPDPEVEEMYYFRWWSFRKHLVKTPAGFVITEFLTPVRHAGIYNTISCAAGFHLAEGRWLHDQNYLDDYIRFWLRGNDGKPQPHFHKFSSWFASAVYDRYRVNHDRKFAVSFLGDFVTDYQTWHRERQLPSGLFWQFDVRDGMEESISGSRTNKNIRPTINSYMFANAKAIAAIARLANKPKLATGFDAQAADLKRLTQENLWDTEANFFKVRLQTASEAAPSGPARPDKNVIPAGSETGAPFSTAREEIGFVPWMFGLPDPGKCYEAAWLQLDDPQGFLAPFGITTAERRHPQFRSHGVGTCEWDGAVWPFATSQTLYALANFLRNEVAATPRRNRVAATPPSREPKGDEASPLPSGDEASPPPDCDEASPLRVAYFDAFLTYVHSQHADGKPYIGEYLDEVTGDWINGKNGRSRYYNHSTFADLLITGVIGLRPRADDTIEIFPLLPAGTWDWFCLDGVKYHGRMLTILWDKDGTRYGRGPGLIVLMDGKEIGRVESLAQLKCRLP